MKFIGSELLFIFGCKSGSKALSGLEVIRREKSNEKVDCVDFFIYRSKKSVCITIKKSLHSPLMFLSLFQVTRRLCFWAKNMHV